MAHVHPTCTQVSTLHRPLRPISVAPEQTRYQTSVDTEAVLRDPAGDALFELCCSLPNSESEYAHKYSGKIPAMFPSVYYYREQTTAISLKSNQDKALKSTYERF